MDEIGVIGQDRIGTEVLYTCSGVLWPHPARVTRLHHRWGTNEAEIPDLAVKWPRTSLLDYGAPHDGM